MQTTLLERELPCSCSKNLRRFDGVYSPAHGDILWQCHSCGVRKGCHSLAHPQHSPLDHLGGDTVSRSDLRRSAERARHARAERETRIARARRRRTAA